MNELDLPHKELHHTIRNILEAKEKGELHVAESEFKKIDQLSGKVVSLLDDIQSNVELEAGC